jgi:hypothetical protein
MSVAGVTRHQCSHKITSKNLVLERSWGLKFLFLIIWVNSLRSCGSVGISSSLDIWIRAYVCGRCNQPSAFTQNHFEELSTREKLRTESPLSYFMGRILTNVKIEALPVQEQCQIVKNRKYLSVEVTQKTWMFTITTLKPLHIIRLYRLCSVSLSDVKLYVVVCWLNRS